MKIEMIPTDKIKPDKEQPRKTFDKGRLEGLAETFKEEGIIQPIEIDENFIITVGERRWRAAKLAGLKELPCIIKKTDNKLKRQLIEEFHKENISALEKARAVKQLITSHEHAKLKGQGIDQGINKTAKELGIGENYIRSLLSVLEDKELEKAVENEKITFTVAQEAKDKLGVEEAKTIAKLPKSQQIGKMEVREIARAKPEVKDELFEEVIEDTKRGYRPTIPQIAEKAKAIEGRRKPVFKLDKKIIPSDLSRKVEETVIQLDNQIKFITENWTLFQTIPQRDKDRLVAILRVHYEAFLKIYKMLGGKLR